MDTSTSNTSSSTTPSVDDLCLGTKVIDYALRMFAWGTAVAVAWSCSTLLMGIIMFIIMAILMYLISQLLCLIILWKAPASTIATLGRTVGRFTRIFARKGPVAA